MNADDNAGKDSMTANFVEVWRTPVADEPNAMVRAVASVESAGRAVAVAVAETTLGVWDLASGQRLVRSTIPDAQEDSTLVSLTIGRLDGNPIAVTADFGGRIQASDVASGEPLGEPVAELHGRPQAVVAAGGLLLVGRGAGATSSVYEVPVADGAVEVWDIAARQRTGWLPHDGYTDSIAVTEYHGRMVAVAGSIHSPQPLLDPDDYESHLTAWDAATGESIRAPIHLPDDSPAGPLAAGVLAGRPVAVVVGRGGLRVWDLAEGREIATVACPGRIEAITWGETAAGPVVLVGGGDIRPDGRNWLRMWDPRDWRPIAETSTGSGRISSCAVAPDGSAIVPWAGHIQLLRPEKS
ncbi:WD40 repeat domain-containing protein [Nocardia sp. NPDC051570]|uniref:WD40 repeat domain-containing protein n=1 Tax=Nocardia sp. NPDC051570 TaxID=3364324 RepID=UPI00379A8C54